MSGPRHGVALALTAVAYNLCHHVGLLPDGLGPAGHGTRVADWVDLAAPFLVLLPALLALVAARADRTTYAVFVVGALLYTQGHGIHLAANSIGNVTPGPTAHFWDETAGHLIWYSGVAVVVVALTRTLAGRTVHWSASLLALATGVTWASNWVGADLAWVGAPPAVAAVVWGAWRASSVPRTPHRGTVATTQRRIDARWLVALSGVAALAFLLVALAMGEA
jgi:hypothetical protein